MEDSLREARIAADAFAEQEALPQLARRRSCRRVSWPTRAMSASAQELCHQALDIAQGQGLMELTYRCDYLLGQIAEHQQRPGCGCQLL